MHTLRHTLYSRKTGLVIIAHDNNAVEKVSDAAERTVMRPSALIGGAVLGLILGAIVYFIARANNYLLGSLEIVALFLIGAVVGVVVELAIRRVRTR